MNPAVIAAWLLIVGWAVALFGLKRADVAVVLASLAVGCSIVGVLWALA